MAKLTLAGLLGLANDQRGLRFWEIIAIASYVIGTILIFFYSVAQVEIWRTFGILALLAGAAWGAGSILGFLFGVPRLRSQSGQAALTGQHTHFTPNTNLEQISDWLTKIIVGATLVQLNAVTARLQATAEYVGAAIGTTAATPVAGAVMVYYATAGFMWGYLWCSFRIFREMIQLAQETDGEEEGTVPDLPPLVSTRDKAAS